jgi:glycerophosphoryl diester phosphodiesterase
MTQPSPANMRPDWDTLRPMPRSLTSTRHPIVIGHRGAQGLAPENTLPAFQAAADLRLDGVEFDVQRTQNDHLVVFHDEDVSRTTNGTGRIEHLTLDALRALDAGSHVGPQFAGERIPTLDEVFDFLRGTDLLLFVELKSPWLYAGIEAQVADLIRAYGLVDQAQVRSFFHPALHVFHAVAPDIAISSLWFEHLPGNDEIRFKTVNALHTLYTPEDIARLHTHGVQTTAWTVDDLDDARRLIDAGIDGLTTNFPDRLLTLFK